MTVPTLNRLNFDNLKLPGIDVPELAIGDVEPPLYIAPATKKQAFLHDIRITAIKGDEGDGKSLMMTKFGMDFYHMGGEVITFPGYELEENGKVISQEITLRQWVQLDPAILKGKLVLIDEITDFCDATLWQTNFVKITSGVYGQRRHTNTGMIYTLQYFEELPKSLRRKTAYIIDCKDAARYNDVRQNQVAEGAKTYTSITDLHGRKNLHLRGFTYRGPTYYNKKYWENYSTEKNPDIMSKFVQVKINKPVIEIDLDGDGKISEKEKVDSQKMYEDAKVKLNNAREKHKGILTNAQFWEATNLNKDLPAHRKIAAALIEDLGIDKNTRSYKFPEADKERVRV